MEPYVKFVENERELEENLVVRRYVFVDEQGIDEEIEIDEYDRLVPERHIVLIKDGRVIGAARLKILGGDAVKYQRICILPQHRGKSLGAFLVSQLDFLATKLGFRSAEIEAQEYTVGFYEGCGFSVSDPTAFLEAGIPHIKMKKFL